MLLQCEIGGLVNAGTKADVDQVMRAGALKFTGNNGYSWGAQPSANSYTANAKIYRLCGNGKEASGAWTVQAFSGAPSSVTLSKCKCTKNVRCRGDTHRENSGLY